MLSSVLLGVIPWGRAHWRPLLVSALLVGAFAAGRFATPAEVRTKTVDKIIYRDRVVTQTVQAQSTATAQIRVVYRDRSTVTRSNGEVERRDVTQVETGRGVARAVESATTRAAEHEGEQVHVATRTGERQAPQWRVSVLAAVDPLHLAAPRFGGEVARRIIGPVWLGVLVLPTGSPVVGLAVGVEF